MKITICGSMAFAKEMVDTKNQLEELGHVVFIPENTDNYLQGKAVKVNGLENAKRIEDSDLTRKHYNLIISSDAILVLNYDKKGVKNYVGGSALMEIGFAHVNYKKVFLLNPAPELSYADEIHAMTDMVVNGDLHKIS